MTDRDGPLAPEPWRAARARYAWKVPDRYNLAEEICERHARATPDRLALIALDAEGGRTDWTYRDLSRASARLANALAARGVARGDRIGVLLPQSPETLIAWLAAARMAAVVVPLFTLFGADGLSYRLADSGCRALVTDSANLAKVATIRDALPALSAVLCVDGPEEGAEGWSEALAPARDAFDDVATGPADPVLISYTSGTTGPPKGALHGHRVLAAHVEGARLAYDIVRHRGGTFWTPADWAWMGGSMNAMGPALVHGIPLVAHRMAKFDPERAFDLMARMEVSAAFLPPTALKLMRRVADPGRFGARLRAVGSAGEAMGAEALAWGREAFGLTINEFYGQTECNMVIGNAAQIIAPKPGAMGLPMPGHEVAVLGPDLSPLRPGLAGELAIRAPDPGQFLGYWGLPEKTAEKMRVDETGAGWLLTGDVAVMDGEGWLTFSSRTDDVITSSGYRVGPTEIEECLAGHPAVTLAAVVGAPDPVRTETIRAFVTLSPGSKPGDRLAAALIAHVKTRLSPHLAPSTVEFVEEIPVTATGKIMRRELRARLVERMGGDEA